MTLRNLLAQRPSWVRFMAVCWLFRHPWLLLRHRGVYVRCRRCGGWLRYPAVTLAGEWRAGQTGMAGLDSSALVADPSFLGHSCV